jgi:hypothetical protein
MLRGVYREPLRCAQGDSIWSESAQHDISETFSNNLFREAAGRPKKMQATCLIDHKWRYNEDLSTPPFDRLRVVSVVEPQS